MKPDRKYKTSKFYLTHIYAVHEMLQKLVAFALLEENDFKEYYDI